eukprot:TRINITY_DN12201_c0_g2_i1.p1 TRINITY_DN12201_c0_g2~~TRINITY_DN12201_c0_g2_i1.p1  ORF type:complete len:261 (+),score=28.79 TRINITY_DN12201_c0_g2_i1:196-978(+)
MAVWVLAWLALVMVRASSAMHTSDRGTAVMLLQDLAGIGLPTIHMDCNPEAPFASGSNCVLTCPPGQAPDPGTGVCVVCQDPAPYADHVQQICTSRCGPGHSPDHERDCKVCPPGTWAEHVELHACVSTCPQGQLAHDSTRDCVQVDQVLPDRLVSCDTVMTNATNTTNNTGCLNCTAQQPWIDPVASKCVSSCPVGFVPQPATRRCSLETNTTTETSNQTSETHVTVAERYYDEDFLQEADFALGSQASQAAEEVVELS